MKGATWLASLFILFSAFFIEAARAEGVSTPELPVSIHLASILVNAIVRVAAIAAGVFIVTLGHRSLIQGIKGDFQFEGKFVRLKGSTPGLLFVLLGALAIGWALQAKHHWKIGTELKESSQAVAPLAGSSVPPPSKPPKSSPDEGPQTPSKPVSPVPNIPRP